VQQTADLYRGTADYYVQFRRPYPRKLVELLVERCGLDGHGRLLDAGCGTGQIFQALAPHFDDVLAIDPDPEMVAGASACAATPGLGKVVVRRMRAEDLPKDASTLRLAAFGASFHWTDRQRVADIIYALLQPAGHLALLSASSTHSRSTDWEQAVQEELRRCLGPERRAGSGVSKPVAR
jgi:SAM-dependent methyltransferase